MRTFSTNSFTYNPAMQQFIIETLLINPVNDAGDTLNTFLINYIYK